MRWLQKNSWQHNGEGPKGLTDAAFGYPSLLHPTYEKRKIREAVESFLMNRRNIGLSRTFKSYVMAVHSYETMRRWGINYNGDSFIK